MDKKSIMSRIRQVSLPAVFFLLGAYPPAMSLWWTTVSDHAPSHDDIVKIGLISSLEIATGGIIGLCVLGLLRAMQHMLSNRWPPSQFSVLNEEKQKKKRILGGVVVAVVCLGFGWVLLAPSIIVWLVIPGATVNVDHQVSLGSAVYMDRNGQLLVAVPDGKNTYVEHYVINGPDTLAAKSRMCERGGQGDSFFPGDISILTTHAIQIETDDDPGEPDMGCESMPGVEVLVDPELSIKSHKITFISPDEQHVEITFWPM